MLKHVSQTLFKIKAIKDWNKTIKTIQLHPDK